jgi:hypothetical protein
MYKTKKTAINVDRLNGNSHRRAFYRNHNHNQMKTIITLTIKNIFPYKLTRYTGCATSRAHPPLLQLVQWTRLVGTNSLCQCFT